MKFYIYSMSVDLCIRSGNMLNRAGVAKSHSEVWYCGQAVPSVREPREIDSKFIQVLLCHAIHGLRGFENLMRRVKLSITCSSDVSSGTEGRRNVRAYKGE